MVDFALFDARGNRYLVATPDQVRKYADLSDNAADAAAQAASSGEETWIKKVSEQVRADTTKRADGLLVGPFTKGGGLGLLIVNTETGDLAERSGNGLTIFAKYLVSRRLVKTPRFVVTVHRSNAVEVPIEPAKWNGEEGFQIDMGWPTYGADAVGALDEYGEDYVQSGHNFSRVSVLEQVDPTWTRSVFVCVDNPHCVTFLDAEEGVVSLDQREEDLRGDLRKIANRYGSGGDEKPFPAGINLQWAYAVQKPGSDVELIHARVFERSEGWTESSGSSATAIASAARQSGFVTGEVVVVKMKNRQPLLIKFDVGAHRVYYFGVAVEV